jgi:hypothetical protein
MSSLAWTALPSNTNNPLYSVWGSSATAVWAVGANGTAVFYDGAQWEVRSPPTTALLWSISGTTADNVFAAGLDRHLYKFDGTSWSLHATLPYGATKAGVFVDGPDSLWVGALDASGGSPGVMALYRSVSGVVTRVGSTSSACYGAAHGASVWAASPTDVWLSGTVAAHYDGTQVTARAAGASGIWGASSAAVLLGFEGALYRWNGTGFDTFDTGLDGTIYGVSGTGPTQVFGAMLLGQSDVGAVFSFDGMGIVQQAIPAGTPSLYAVWAAPSGEVFAVGNGGTIIEGT